MGKSATKNEDAVVYNEELAVKAEELADRLEDEDVKKWCAAVAKQHRFHERRHRAALARRAEKSVEEEEEVFSEVHEAEPSLEEQQKIFAETYEEDREVSRDAGSGQFVSHEYADENPETTVTETVEVKRAAHVHSHQLPCGPGCPAYNESEVNA